MQYEWAYAYLFVQWELTHASIKCAKVVLDQAIVFPFWVAVENEFNWLPSLPRDCPKEWEPRECCQCGRFRVNLRVGFDLPSLALTMFQHSVAKRHSKIGSNVLVLIRQQHHDIGVNGLQPILVAVRNFSIDERDDQRLSATMSGETFGDHFVQPLMRIITTFKYICYSHWPRGGADLRIRFVHLFANVIINWGWSHCP